MGRIRIPWMNLALLGISLIVTFFFAEIALRILGFSAPYITRVDLVTGFSLRPNAEIINRDEGTATVHINALGMRDAERTTEKPEATYRIAVLGDSYTEARQVDLEETFTQLTEQALRSCPVLEGKNVEVLNFGVSGFGTTQEYLLLQDRVWNFSPDLVLLAFTTGNDIANNSFALEGNTQKPYFLLNNGDLRLDTSFRETEYFKRQESFRGKASLWLLQHSRVAQLGYRALKSGGAATSGTGAVAGAEAGIDAAIYNAPKNPEWTEAWSITELILEKMIGSVREKHAAFALMTLSNGIQVHPDRAVREAFKQAAGSTDLLYPDKRLETFAARNGVPFLMLAPELREYAERTGTFLHGFPGPALGTGHWNEKGHELAAEHLAGFLCQKVLGAD